MLFRSLVPRAVLEGIEAVRTSTGANMQNNLMVIKMANKLGHPQAAFWVQQNPDKYFTGIDHGFEAE